MWVVFMQSRLLMQMVSGIVADALHIFKHTIFSFSFCVVLHFLRHLFSILDVILNPSWRPRIYPTGLHISSFMVELS